MGKTIWYISKYAVPPNYGNPTRQYFLSKYLAKAGHNVTLVYSRSSMFGNPPAEIHKPSISDQEGIRQVMLPGPLVQLGFSLKRIWSWILFESRVRKWARNESEKPDVVIVSSLSILTFLTGIYLKKRYKCKLVVEVRDIYPFTLVATGKFRNSNLVVKYLSYVERKAYQKADLIISTLEFFESHLSKVHPQGVDKYKHIPMGVDLDYFNVDLERILPKFDLPKGDAFVVGYAGTFGMTQATGVIFDVIQKLKDVDEIHFVLAGDGVEKEKGLQKIRGQSNYTDLGRIDKNQVPQMLKECDVVLNPWLDLEIYKYGISPNKWMDYMFAAKPIIVGFAGNSKLIEKAGCGSVIAPENTDALISEIYRYKDMAIEERKIIGKNGRDYLEKNLTYEKHARVLLDAIKNC